MNTVTIALLVGLAIVVFTLIITDWFGPLIQKANPLSLGGKVPGAA